MTHLVGFLMACGFGIISLLLARGAPETDNMAKGLRIAGPVMFVIGLLYLVSDAF